MFRCFKNRGLELCVGARARTDLLQPPEPNRTLRRNESSELARGQHIERPVRDVERVDCVLVLPLVNAPLVTIGAKTGQPREAQLTYFHDGPDPILIASNFGGQKHPAWYHNLKANPECRFGGEHFIADEVTDPDEHARLYALAEQVYAGYGDYLAKTAPQGRRIPLFRLRPAK